MYGKTINVNGINVFVMGLPSYSDEWYYEKAVNILAERGEK